MPVCVQCTKANSPKLLEKRAVDDYTTSDHLTLMMMFD